MSVDIRYDGLIILIPADPTKQVTIVTNETEERINWDENGILEYIRDIKAVRLKRLMDSIPKYKEKTSDK